MMARTKLKTETKNEAHHHTQILETETNKNKSIKRNEKRERVKKMAHVSN